MRVLIIACALLFSCLIPSKNEALYLEGSVRGGLFFPTNHWGKCALPLWSPFFQLESSFHFAEPWRAIPWTGWANIGLGFGLGHFCHQHNAVWFPISGGLKYSWCCGDMRELYVGLGMTISWLDSRGSGGQSKKGVGGVIKTGIRQYYWDCSFREFFIDYTINPYKGLKLNGLMIGIACGSIF